LEQASVHRAAKAARGDPQHSVAGELKVRVADAITLERAACAMESEAVELDDQSLARPEDVDLESRNARVEHRRRQSRPAAELGEAALQCRARIRRVASF
jgi:hypothetical protein